MNIHEYQAKGLLEKFGVATTRGRVASTPEEAEAIARELAHGERDVAGPRIWSSDAAPPKEATSSHGAGAQHVDLVVKAQVHAGGRGKGTFKNGFKGGVHIVKSPKEAREAAEKMLGQTLVTHQTGPAGRVVNKVLVGESANIAREIYFAILLDRATAAPLIVASTEGGVEIETVAEKSPEKIMREHVDPLAGLQ
ncbi:MAG: succinyl-CoA synthetase beta subunit, partial [Verrucomicrobiota bacterium]